MCIFIAWVFSLLMGRGIGLYLLCELSDGLMPVSVQTTWKLCVKGNKLCWWEALVRNSGTEGVRDCFNS